MMLLMSVAVAMGQGESEVSATMITPTKIPWTQLENEYEGVFYLSASREVRKVALTFDDIPASRVTPQILDVLKEKNVHSTFFAVGSRSLKHHKLLQRIHSEGHAVGNHSYNHPDFSKMTLAEFQGQIKRTERIIEKTIGFKPRLIRPPYGEVLPEQLEWARKAGYAVVNWDVDSQDWRQLSADEIFNNVTRSVRPGSVILLHAGGGAGQSLKGTVEALPRIIDWLRDNHYEPVKLTELLNIPEIFDNEKPSPN
ncbi:MAG: polysaccharide deacetylase family protein [Candidatus Cohnella colombiensis]|uniref:Polysaccharide deacetylase family protein n=1 Tax=Candidatus Cohnella colombiensis TaxID=3121368 RepID=A0AA95EUD8_9BACL|nr:MAG: polysaccharide deacetylase family protein [Cohnella sp.]